MLELWMKICLTSAVVVVIDLLASIMTNEDDSALVQSAEAYIGIVAIVVFVVSVVSAIWAS